MLYSVIGRSVDTHSAPPHNHGNITMVPDNYGYTMHTESPLEFWLSPNLLSVLLIRAYIALLFFRDIHQYRAICNEDIGYLRNLVQ